MRHNSQADGPVDGSESTAPSGRPIPWLRGAIGGPDVEAVPNGTIDMNDVPAFVTCLLLGGCP